MNDPETKLRRISQKIRKMAEKQTNYFSFIDDEELYIDIGWIPNRLCDLCEEIETLAREL